MYAIVKNPTDTVVGCFPTIGSACYMAQYKLTQSVVMQIIDADKGQLVAEVFLQDGEVVTRLVEKISRKVYVEVDTCTDISDEQLQQKIKEWSNQTLQIKSVEIKEVG